jgi:hypothetical protein
VIGLRTPAALRVALWAAAAMIAGGSLALHYGQTASWDLRNYHVYAPWAWMSGRLGIDVAPAQVQSFFNPLLHLPLHLALPRFSSATITFWLGAIPALAGLLLWRIGAVLLPPDSARPSFTVLCALAGMFGAGSLGLIGTTFGDNFIALLGLIAIALLLSPAVLQHARTERALLAGLALGAAAGLKLAFAPFALSLWLATPLLARDRRTAVRLVLATGTGAAVAFALCASAWMAEMQQRYGNPVYPFFASVFASEWNPHDPVRDVRFVPASVLDALLEPLLWNFDWRLASDYRFRDLRVFAALLALVSAPWWLARIEPAPRRAAVRFLLLAFAIGYALWLALFGYYRYLLLWEWLAPLLLAVALLAGARRRALVLGVLALLVISTNPPDDERVPANAGPMIAIELDGAPLASDTMVVIAGGEPLAYLLPHLPGLGAAVRIGGSLFESQSRPFALHVLARQRIAVHRGPLAVLFQKPTVDAIDPELAAFGLVRRGTSCRELHTNLAQPHEAPIRLCDLERLPPRTH